MQQNFAKKHVFLSLHQNAGRLFYSQAVKLLGMVNDVTKMATEYLRATKLLYLHHKARRCDKYGTLSMNDTHVNLKHLEKTEQVTLLCVVSINRGKRGIIILLKESKILFTNYLKMNKSICL